MDSGSRVARLAIVVTGVIVGGLLALQVSLPRDAPPITSEMYSIHKWWYMGRAGGFIAFGLLFASVVLGLGVSSRVFDGLLMRSWVYDLHQFLSIFVLLAMAFHALILLPDPYAHFSLADLAVPFASPYRPIAVGVGVIVLYGSVVVTLSFYFKRWIGQRLWRQLHYASFALFAGALAHGVTAGTDTGESWAQVAYLASATIVIFLVFFRILAARDYARRRPAPRTERTVKAA
jgi:predicted ferric reductase